MADFPIYDHDPRNLPTDLVAAIGLAIASAAMTDDIIQAAIAGLAGLDYESGKAITTHMPMPIKYDVLRSLAEIKLDDPDVLDGLDNHIENIQAAFGRRNDIAHDTWARDEKTGALFRISEKSRVRYEMRLIPIVVEDVRADALAIYQAGIDFMQFLMLHGFLPPLPTGRRAREHKTRAARKERRKTLGKL